MLKKEIQLAILKWLFEDADYLGFKYALQLLKPTKESLSYFISYYDDENLDNLFTERDRIAILGMVMGIVNDYEKPRVYHISPAVDEDKYSYVYDLIVEASKLPSDNLDYNSTVATLTIYTVTVHNSKISLEVWG